MDAGAMRRMCDSHQVRNPTFLCAIREEITGTDFPWHVKAYRCLAPAVRCEDAVQVLRTLAQVGLLPRLSSSSPQLSVRMCLRF